MSGPTLFPPKGIYSFPILFYVFVKDVLLAIAKQIFLKKKLEVLPRVHESISQKMLGQFLHVFWIMIKMLSLKTNYSCLL
jgi:hypothetical protein